MTQIVVISVLLVVGLVSTIINSIAGGGSGMILIPMLTLFFGFSPVLAVGTTIVVSLVGSLVSTSSYSKMQVVDYRKGFLFGTSAVPGVIGGSFFTNAIPSQIFVPILAFVVMGFAAMMYQQSETKPLKGMQSEFKSEVESRSYKVNIGFAVPAVILVGFFIGAFGAGGGLILTPVLSLAGLPILLVLGTNRLVITLIVTGATGVKILLGQVDFDFALWLSIGAVLGGIIGTQVVRVMNKNQVRRIVALIIIFLAVFMLLESMP